MENKCLNCQYCVFKYDMYLCVRDNMPEPVGSESTCNDFVMKKVVVEEG